MIKPLGPSRPRGRWWVWVVVVALLGMPGRPGFGQDGKGSSKKGQDRPAGKKGAAKAAEKPAAEDAPKLDPQELWQDPLAEELVDPKPFRPLPPQVLMREDTPAIRAMAQGRERVDVPTIRRYVGHYVGELTRHANLQALITPGGDPKVVKVLETASDELIRPLTEPANAANASFRAAYTKALLDVARDVLKNQLHARTMMMVVLSRTEDPQALPTFITQLNDPNQVLAVKILAAVGIANLARHGQRSLPAQQGAEAARALAEFLNREVDAPWPVKYRALEALGSIRLAAANPLKGTAEFADVAMAALTDAEAKPNVRAAAGWALGMMQVPGRVQDYNYGLVAHAIGRAAAAIGDRIVQVPDRGTTQVNRLAVQILQLLDALKGDPQVRDSGLATAARGSDHRAVVGEVQKRVEAIARDAIELSRSAGVQKKARRGDLEKSIADLKSYLAKKPPDGQALYKGGPEFNLALDRVDVVPRPK